MKISFITTVFNEGDSIMDLLESLNVQTLIPDEIVVVDGGSTDNTLSVISNFKFQNKKVKVRVLTIKGNRSVGRNFAIKNSTGDIIIVSDAGCELDKNWIKNITKPFENSSVDVVAGYYKGLTKNIFEKSLIPYVFVMPDRIDSNNFLPATRSMAFKKSVWEKIGGFSERYSHNEDYVFARNLREKKFNIFFEKSAIVYWHPPKTLIKVFIMFLRFAYGDSEAKIYRPKAMLVLVRYLIALLFTAVLIISHSLFVLFSISLAMLGYILWAILKNYKYVNNYLGFIYLPLFQFLSDFAVIIGTCLGTIKRIGNSSSI